MPNRGASEPIRVLSVPAGHPYVARAVGVPGEVADGLAVLPDALPPGRPAGQWWPSPVFDPVALPGLLTGADVLHVHFGFEGAATADLEDCLRIVRAAAVPLVLTVHDLQDPHGQDEPSYAARLGLLVAAADALVTLTPGAAREIRQRWGRPAAVLPHPHVAPLERVGVPRGSADRPLVGVDLKSLRANVLRPPALADLADAILATGAALRVGVHAEALERGFVRYDAEVPALLARWRDRGVAVAVHERYADAALLDHLAGLDALVLPYRFGTHSGLLEACRDVGTAVVAPAVGHYRDQHDCPTYEPADPRGSIPGALRAALAARSRWAAGRAERAAEAVQVRAAHRRLYRDVLAGRRTRAAAWPADALGADAAGAEAVGAEAADRRPATSPRTAGGERA